MNNNNEEKPVIFHEERVVKTNPRYAVSQELEMEIHDRMIKLLMQISGGRIKSAKVARNIIFILVAIMIAISVYWFFT